ncbi:flagellar basal body-associated FliL family protein [Tranquillimonas alkanivorans]|uniref:Flagellar protein FliL n=1 Tax=Tranquillimonas alkanivorans TaxID=441119 RepID=A0A1I5S3Q9_9RHOB|nr:flagellar basal body-associated FliL family protein [Tranquillimonas alkanivorans]SFP65370.1 flagellar FliL protein [Tranquillimonas alkanivorans]
MSSSASPDAAAAAEYSTRGTFVRRVGVVLLLAFLSAAALAGGIAASVGPQALVDFILQREPTPDAAPAPEGAAPADEGHGAEEETAKTFAVMPFDEIIVNITSTTASGRRTTRFLKLNVALVYDDKAHDAGMIEERLLYMRDAFQDYLRLLTERDLQGSLGLTRLKAELLRRARAVSGSDAPREILIADLIIQ